MEKNDVIERVRKILAKTENAGCTQAEAELAFQTASRIMAEHNLDMAEVEQKDEGSVSWVEEDAFETGRYTLEDNLAYGIVHRHFFVEAFFSFKWVNGKARKVLRFFGQPHNVETAKWAFNALLDAFDRLFREYRKTSGCPATDRRLFISGVANGFSEKMNDERRAMATERDLLQGKVSGSTALAVLDIAKQTNVAFQEAHKSFFKKDGSTKGRASSFAAVTGSRSSFEAGQAAGRNLNLNRAIGGSQQRKLEG